MSLYVIQYITGVLCGLLMVMLSSYFLKKYGYVRFGTGKRWMFYHVIIGILFLCVVVYHGNYFDIRSLNGEMTLMGTLISIFTGFFGRFIYLRIQFTRFEKLFRLWGGIHVAYVIFAIVVTIIHTISVHMY